MRIVTRIKLAVFAAIVVALNGAFWMAIRHVPTLKDQIPWFTIAAFGILSVGVLAAIIFRSVPGGERSAARVGIGSVVVLQAVLIGGVYFWQRTTARRAPKIPRAMFQIADNLPAGSHIGHVQVEQGNPGDLKYEIISKRNDGSHNFNLDSATGELTLAGTATMNARHWPMFVLQIRATDEFETSGEGSVVIKVVDENQPPRVRGNIFDIDSYTGPDMSLGFVPATDPDGDRLEYQIKAGNDSGLFAIDETSGALRITDSGKLPRAASTIELEIEVSDGMAPPVSCKCLVRYHVVETN